MFEIIVSWLDLDEVTEAMRADQNDMGASDIDLGEETRQAKGVFCIRDEFFSERNLNALEKLRQKAIPFYGCYQTAAQLGGWMFCCSGSEITFAPCGKNFFLQVRLDDDGNPISSDIKGARQALQDLHRAREKVLSRGLQNHR
jgi:hypothetical protein